MVAAPFFATQSAGRQTRRPGTCYGKVSKIQKTRNVAHRLADDLEHEQKALSP